MRYLPDKETPLTFDTILEIEPEVTIGADAGIEGAVSGGIYGSGSMPIKIEFFDQHLTISLKGEFGVEGQIFIFSGKKAIVEGSTNLVDKYWGSASTNSVATTAHVMPDYGVEETSVSNKTSVVSRDYALDTSEWLGKAGKVTALNVYSVNSTGSAAAPEGVSFHDLQTSIFTDSRPQLVTFGDQMLLVWVEDDTTRDTYNRMRLVYSVYDPDSDTWSEPVPVWDDGYNDGYPSLVSDGENVWVVWQKITTTVTEADCSSIDVVLENSEICLAQFDTVGRIFTNQQQLTDNDLYEYTAVIGLNEGSPMVCWAAAEENAISDAGCTTIYGWKSGWTGILKENLNYVLSIDVLGEEICYIMDGDGDTTTTSDINAFTLSDSETTEFERSNDTIPVTFAEFATLNGVDTLFFSDMMNIYYIEDGEVKTVLTETRSIGNSICIVETAAGTTIIWTETVEEWNELYAVSYENGNWTDPVQISDNGENLSFVNVVSHNGAITGVCNSNAVTYDEPNDTYTKGQTNLTVFTVNDFTDIALGSFLYFDESLAETGNDTAIAVSVYNKGTTAINEVTFTIMDALGTEFVQTVSMEITSGSSALVSLNYPVPENYASTTLTIYAETVEADADESDNTVSLEIGMHDLSITETGVEILDGGYMLKTLIENSSLVNAENVIIEIALEEEDAEPVQTVSAGMITRENYALAEILLSEDVLIFDENGTSKVYLKVSADGSDSADADNQVCILLTQREETVCLHPVTEMVEEKKANCTDSGLTEGERCAACGEFLTPQETIPATGHNYQMPVFEWVEDNTCTATLTCSDCDDTQAEDCAVTSETTPATETEEGKIVYTATVVIDGQTYTDTKTVVIPVTAYVKGDINGDGNVNNRDAARLMQYLAGMWSMWKRLLMLTATARSTTGMRQD